MTPIHVVSGFLGAGKTTLLLNQLARREGAERCAVVVNDFGTAAFDATLLGGKALVRDIPGGCVCCTAPENLAPTVDALLKAGDIDRIFIEATGLARPADLVDTLGRQLKGAGEIAPVVVVLDPARLLEPEPPPLLLEQLEAAEVLILGHVDRASEAALEAGRRAAAAHYPPLLGFLEAVRGEVAPEAFDLRPDPSARAHAHEHAHDHGGPSTEGYGAASGGWPAEVTFDMGALRGILTGAGAERIKGLFHTDIGWYRVEWASGALDRGPTQSRGQSRVDVILKGAPAKAEAVVSAIDGARYVAPSADELPGIRISGAGVGRTLNREDLLGLPEQVADVATIVPGREGRGVMLRAALKAAGAPEGARFIVVAKDGMTTDPAPLSAVGDAVLVHSEGEGPFPESKGGPFRIFVPKDAERSACANVKKVDRIIIEMP